MSHLKYGGEEHLDAPPRELLLAQTEDYVEYSRHGAVLKGQEKAIARSKYEEDVLLNNHTVSTADGHRNIMSAVVSIIEKFDSIVLFCSVSGARFGKTASGVTSAATRWSNRVTALERLAR